MARRSTVQAGRRGAPSWLRRLLGEERGVSLITQIAGLAVGVSMLGVVTVIFNAATGVSGNAESAITTTQRADSGLQSIANTLRHAVEGEAGALQGTHSAVVAQVPDPAGGLRVVRFCLQFVGPDGDVLYRQMVHEPSVDSSSFISTGLTDPCPDPEWTYGGEPSAAVVAERVTNYRAWPLRALFTLSEAPEGGRQSLSIDLYVTPRNAPERTRLTASVTPRLQVAPE